MHYEAINKFHCQFLLGFVRCTAPMLPFTVAVDRVNRPTSMRGKCSATKIWRRSERLKEGAAGFACLDLPTSLSGLKGINCNHPSNLIQRDLTRIALFFASVCFLSGMVVLFLSLITWITCVQTQRAVFT